ncbi:hypothetical protein [Streptomyces sp. NPDC012888]|uniref:hypothetical protein n=1 Tax=Streptomyces sp. NPDC012888 TaxID=3364855 RepID=UPI0036C06FD7
MSGLLITCTVIVCWTALVALAIVCLHRGSQQQREARQASRGRHAAHHHPSWAHIDPHGDQT